MFEIRKFDLFSVVNFKSAKGSLRLVRLTSRQLSAYCILGSNDL